jgi:hypothetical protein
MIGQEFKEARNLLGFFHIHIARYGLSQSTEHACHVFKWAYGGLYSFHKVTNEKCKIFLDSCFPRYKY